MLPQALEKGSQKKREARKMLPQALEGESPKKARAGFRF